MVTFQSCNRRPQPHRVISLMLLCRLCPTIMAGDESRYTATQNVGLTLHKIGQKNRSYSSIDETELYHDMQFSKTKSTFMRFDGKFILIISKDYHGTIPIALVFFCSILFSVSPKFQVVVARTAERQMDANSNHHFLKPLKRLHRNCQFCAVVTAACFEACIQHAK